VSAAEELAQAILDGRVSLLAEWDDTREAVRQRVEVDRPAEGGVLPAGVTRDTLTDSSGWGVATPGVGIVEVRLRPDVLLGAGAAVWLPVDPTTGCVLRERAVGGRVCVRADHDHERPPFGGARGDLDARG
jgi:hypothetical protein